MEKEAEKLEVLLAEHYMPLLTKHGDSYGSVNWGSQKSQTTRFKVLVDSLPLSGSEIPSILDVGCGLGHLLSYILENDLPFSYFGIDAVSQMIEQAQIRHPQMKSKFQTAQLSKFESQQFDYVVASGIFYVACDKQRMEQDIASMFNLCKKAIAFNSLSSWATHKDQGEFYADPIKVLQFCRTLTPRCVLHHDYMGHDFTIHLFRES